jgi:hypothetical protein
VGTGVGPAVGAAVGAVGGFETVRIAVVGCLVGIGVVGALVGALVGCMVVTVRGVRVVMTCDLATVSVVFREPSTRFGTTAVRVEVVFAMVVVELAVMLLAVVVTAVIVTVESAVVSMVVLVTLLGSSGLVVVATPAAEVSVVKTVTDSGLVLKFRVLVLVIVLSSLVPLVATTVWTVPVSLVVTVEPLV